MVKIYAVKLDREIDFDRLNRLMFYLSPEKQYKVKRHWRYEDVKRTILSEILIRRIIKDRFKLSNNDIVFSYNHYGKPFVKHINDFHFNISHSGEWVICAVHHLPLGIDIEKIQPAVDLRIAQQFFTPYEYKALLQKRRHDRATYFFILWTLKESYIKAVEKGLSIPLNAFSIDAADAENIRIRNPYEEDTYFFRIYHLESYILSTCTKDESDPDSIIMINLEELLAYG